MSQIQPSIRAAAADFLEIAALDRIAWLDTPDGDFIPDGEHTWRIWCEFALVNVVRNEQGTLVAAVVAFPCLDTWMWLHKVIVEKSQRGRGLGSLLLRGVTAELDRIQRHCFLTVAPGNEPALRLYHKHGFEKSEFIPGFYRPTEDRLILRRKPQVPSQPGTATPAVV